MEKYDLVTFLWLASFVSAIILGIVFYPDLKNNSQDKCTILRKDGTEDKLFLYNISKQGNRNYYAEKISSLPQEFWYFYTIHCEERIS